MADSVAKNGSIQCTAGAIPMRNDKGQTYMQKVKVHRYMAGKRPDFASDSESGESEFEDENAARQNRLIESERERESISVMEQEPTAEELNDPRFRRLIMLKKVREENCKEIGVDSDAEDEEDRVMRHKRYQGVNDDENREDLLKSDEEEDAEYLDEDELARRREAIRQRTRRRREEEDREAAAHLQAYPDEQADEEEEDEEEEEEEEDCTSSEDDMGAPKLRPVFVRKQERITLQAKQLADQIAREAEEETKRIAGERRRDTLKLLEAEIRREADEARVMKDELDALDSDDATGDDPQKDQEEYELWKVRELKRIRRDREEREASEHSKAEIERIRNMTESERLAEFRKNPKEITNQVNKKGKYKFLQKYFHRGAFYVQTDEEKVYQRDFAEPTLEDHFDKTKLPAVMQVKNFGRAGRTKYTHLVDQDTTVHDAAWSSNDQQLKKFQMAHGGGFKNVFEKPTGRKK